MIRKIRLISKFMTSQPGSQTMAIHILANISRIKDKQTIEFDQLKNITREIFFFKNHAENEARRLVLDPFLSLKKIYMRQKQSVCSFAPIYLDSLQLCMQERPTV